MDGAFARPGRLIGVWCLLAVAAAAVGVVFFLRRGAVLARAILGMDRLGLVRFEGAMGHGNFFSFRGEDDVVNGVVGIGEGAVAEIAQERRRRLKMLAVWRLMR